MLQNTQKKVNILNKGKIFNTFQRSVCISIKSPENKTLSKWYYKVRPHFVKINGWVKSWLSSRAADEEDEWRRRQSLWRGIKRS